VDRKIPRIQSTACSDEDDQGPFQDSLPNEETKLHYCQAWQSLRKYDVYNHSVIGRRLPVSVSRSVIAPSTINLNKRSYTLNILHYLFVRYGGRVVSASGSA